MTSPSPLELMSLNGADMDSLAQMVGLCRSISIGQAAMDAGLEAIDTVELLGWFAMVADMRRDKPEMIARMRILGEAMTRRKQHLAAERARDQDMATHEAHAG